MKKKELVIGRAWSMPSKNTFTIRPITALLKKTIKKNETWLDPFSNDNTIKKLGFKNVITNDINKSYESDYHVEANDFLDMFKEERIDGILFDPPFSPRQLSECYRSCDIPISQDLT